MSGVGKPTESLSHFLDVKSGKGKKIAIIAAGWHPEIVDTMTLHAQAELERLGCKKIDLYRVPGSFEIPVMAAHLIGSYDGLVTLGLVLRGETAHFDYVCSGVTQGITHLAVTKKKPIAFGVLMCDTLQQAIDRSGAPEAKENKGLECAQAVIATLLAIDSIKISS
ncbi:MAG: 6,7-dimethyl-8-ribityllumazine synthase [Actinomycetota bacterium]